MLGLAKLVQNPKFWRHFHVAMTALWILLAIPSITIWRDSVPWLVGISVYAIVIGHISAWQGSRAEDASGG